MSQRILNLSGRAIPASLRQVGVVDPEGAVTLGLVLEAIRNDPSNLYDQHVSLLLAAARQASIRFVWIGITLFMQQTVDALSVAGFVPVRLEFLDAGIRRTLDASGVDGAQMRLNYRFRPFLQNDPVPEITFGMSLG